MERKWIKSNKASHAEAPVEPTPLVAVIGVGFVGTGLVDSFSSKYDILGFDISEERVKELRVEFEARPNVTFTSTEPDLKRATHFLVSVPTLLRMDKTIDLSYLRSALDKVKRWAQPGSTVVIESSVAIGLTRELLGPIAKSRRLFAGMSPEVSSTQVYSFSESCSGMLTFIQRIDPGRTEPPMRTIPKVVSGLDDVIPGSLDAVVRLYGRVFDSIVPMSKPEVAEMTKLYENCQRMMCTAYVNEMADACRGLGIDPYEVCKAAATKPFGYLPFGPSLGVGGHCIPVNPYYLLSNSDFPLLQAAAETMNERPTEIAQRIIDGFFGNDKDSRRDSGVELKKRVLVVGMGFKAGQSHLVNSPGLQLAQELNKFELDVVFADSLVSQSAVPNIPRLSDEDWVKEKLENFDLIVVSFKQKGMDFDLLAELEGVPVQMWCH